MDRRFMGATWPHLSAFCTRKPATMPMVVGSDAAQTPSRFKVFSSIPDATMSGGAHLPTRRGERGERARGGVRGAREER
eukprot:6544288-Prymnesium_polylepis.2